MGWSERHAFSCLGISKLPLNTLPGWIVLSQVPAPWFWPGMLLILGVSARLLWAEADSARPRSSAAAGGAQHSSSG
jgi:hypothetical protein